MTRSALPIWQRSFKQRPVHSEAQSALIHAQHKPCLPSLPLSLILSHSLSLFIYLPSLLSNRAAKWSTAAVSQPAVVLTIDRRTDDAVRLRPCAFSLNKVRNWSSSDAHCDLDHKYLCELLICRHLECCDSALFCSFTLFPLLLYPSSLPHSCVLVSEAWDILIISWSAATHKAGLSSCDLSES